MQDTRHLRQRPTRLIDETQFAAVVGQVIGPPGLARHAPLSPALFPPPKPITRRLAVAVPPVALGGSLALIFLLARPQPAATPIPAIGPLASVTATATITPPPPTWTTTATATSSPTATATATATSSPTATATVTIPPTATPRPAPAYVPPTATPRPVVQLPAPPATQVVAIPAVTPGSGPAGGDWSDSIFARSATISGTPQP